ncbi:hypothetical protein IE53DRAFT_371955 [Violaceomyces palustris]|uniref:Uncharacterized protein n=1 Tax=Violaceomyces palustris TaxID=1673888 RepID=A0ACD0NM11_9BASI|nr:hypothetical protein IE53DRAFT_371955 [Violaceomyces palustris]
MSLPAPFQLLNLVAVQGNSTASATTNTTTSIDDSIFVPTALVKAGVTYIILYSTLATLLFVLLCVVLLKDGLRAHKRKLPIFWTLGVAMIGGLLGSVLNTVFWATQLFGTADENLMFRFWMASSAMLYIVPLITHCAITMRIASFYPPSLAKAWKRASVIAFPVMIKVVRLAAIVMIMVYSSTYYHRWGFYSSNWGDVTGLDHWSTVIAVLQFVDNLYATCFLSWKFYHFGRRSKSGLMLKRTAWFSQLLKQILFAMAFSYVLPTLFALGILICKVLPVRPQSLGYILVANVYVQIFGAVFALLSTAHRWREDRFTASLRPGASVVVPRTNGDEKEMDEDEVEGETGDIAYDRMTSSNTSNNQRYNLSINDTEYLCICGGARPEPKKSGELRFRPRFLSEGGPSQEPVPKFPAFVGGYSVRSADGGSRENFLTGATTGGGISPRTKLAEGIHDEGDSFPIHEKLSSSQEILSIPEQKEIELEGVAIQPGSGIPHSRSASELRKALPEVASSTGHSGISNDVETRRSSDATLFVQPSIVAQGPIHGSPGKDSLVAPHTSLPSQARSPSAASISNVYRPAAGLVSSKGGHMVGKSSLLGGSALSRHTSLTEERSEAIIGDESNPHPSSAHASPKRRGRASIQSSPSRPGSAPAGTSQGQGDPDAIVVIGD